MNAINKKNQIMGKETTVLPACFEFTLKYQYCPVCKDVLMVSQVTPGEGEDLRK